MGRIDPFKILSPKEFGLAKKIKEKAIAPHILVVDDVSETLDLIKTYLETFEPVKVITCLNGKDALDEFIKTDFALILLDVDMPNMDGFEVARKMREINLDHQIPIIYITGYDREGKRASTGYEVGAVDYILKPLNMEFLLSKTRVFLKLYYQRKKLEEEISERVYEENKLKESNRNVSLIIDGTPECICTFSRTGKIEAINLAGLKLLGLESQERIVGANFSKWVLLSDQTKFLNALANACSGNETLINISLQTITNEVRLVDLTIVPMKDGGRFKSLIGLAIDVTNKGSSKSSNNKKKHPLVQSKDDLKLSFKSPDTFQPNAEKIDTKLEKKVKKNVNKILLPMLEKLKKLSPENSQYYDLMSSAMNDITETVDTNSLKEFKKLNSKEIEIFNLFKNGLTNKEISDQLNKSERNVSFHLSQIFKKLRLVKKEKTTD